MCHLIPCKATGEGLNDTKWHHKTKPEGTHEEEFNINIALELSLVELIMAYIWFYKRSSLRVVDKESNYQPTTLFVLASDPKFMSTNQSLCIRLYSKVNVNQSLSLYQPLLQRLYQPITLFVLASDPKFMSTNHSLCISLCSKVYVNQSLSLY